MTMNAQCEKHAKKEEALEKLRNGTKFDEVAREFSEDKARQGMYSIYLVNSVHLISLLFLSLTLSRPYARMIMRNVQDRIANVLCDRRFPGLED
jgi:hypothetical protein